MKLTSKFLIGMAMSVSATTLYAFGFSSNDGPWNWGNDNYYDGGRYGYGDYPRGRRYGGYRGNNWMPWSNDGPFNFSTSNSPWNDGPWDRSWGGGNRSWRGPGWGSNRPYRPRNAGPYPGYNPQYAPPPPAAAPMEAPAE